MKNSKISQFNDTKPATSNDFENMRFFRCIFIHTTTLSLGTYYTPKLSHFEVLTIAKKTAEKETLLLTHFYNSTEYVSINCNFFF